MNLKGVFMENITYDCFGNEIHVGDTLIRLNGIEPQTISHVLHDGRICLKSKPFTWQGCQIEVRDYGEDPKQFYLFTGKYKK